MYSVIHFSFYFPEYLTNKLFWPQLFKRYSMTHSLNRQGGSDAMTIQSDSQVPGVEGGTPRNIEWGCAARFPKPLPYFRPKSAIFLYPISDLTKNLTPYFRPDSYIDTLFQTCLMISSLVQTNVKRQCLYAFTMYYVLCAQSFEIRIPHYKARCTMCCHNSR